MYRVIVAEDEDIIRKGLVYSVPWLEMNCSVVAEAKNGVEGVEMIGKYQPDIVLADIDMPIKDGLEMIRETYQEYEYAAILLSGYSTFEYAQKAIRYGVLDYILKPLDVEELKGAVKKAADKVDARRAFLERKGKKEKLERISLIGQPPGEPDAVVSAMLSYIDGHYQEKVLTRDVAARLNYSEAYLNRRFKEVMGTTFIEYLNRYRIQKALEMLWRGGMKVQDIAWQCGIGEYKYFNTVFKKYIGCSPKEYMALIR